MTELAEQELGADDGAACTHSWKTCPIHGAPDGEIPPMRVVLSCIYGGAELKDGGTWDDTTSREVTKKVAAKLWPKP